MVQKNSKVVLFCFVLSVFALGDFNLSQGHVVMGVPELGGLP